jgi:hypothetical protein
LRTRIKIERPDGGGFARGYDEAVHGNASYFVWLNRGKESLTLGIKSEQGRTVLTELLCLSRDWVWSGKNEDSKPRSSNSRPSSLGATASSVGNMMMPSFSSAPSLPGTARTARQRPNIS